MILCGKENSPVQLPEKVKLLSFWWIKANSIVFHYSFYDWCQNLFLCAGIDESMLFVVELLLYILTFFSDTPCAGRIIYQVIYLILISFLKNENSLYYCIFILPCPPTPLSRHQLGLRLFNYIITIIYPLPSSLSSQCIRHW